MHLLCEIQDHILRVLKFFPFLLCLHGFRFSLGTVHYGQGAEIFIFEAPKNKWPP